MKLSKIQQIIKEEVAKALNETRYADKVGNAIRSKAKGKSEKDQMKMIFDYLKQDGNTNTEISNLMNSDFVSDVLQVIKSGAEDKNRELNDKFAAAVGHEKPAPGGPENKLRSVKEESKEKTYKFEYDYFSGSDDVDQDEVVVTASSEAEAREKAYKEAEQDHTQIRTKKENFRLIKN